MIGKNEGSSVITVVDNIIANAVKNEFNVLRFSPSDNGLAVIGGAESDPDATCLALINQRVAQTVITRLKIMGNLSIAERRCKQSGFIEFPFDGRVIKIPVKSIPGPNGEEIILDLENKPIAVRASG